MENWSTNPAVLADFYKRVAYVVLGLDTQPTDTVLIYHDSVLSAVGEWGQLTEYDNPDAAFQDFFYWWRKHNLEITIIPGVTSITLSIHPKVGGVQTTVSAVFDMLGETEGNRVTVIGELSAMLCKMWVLNKDTVADNIRKAGMSQEPTGTQPPTTSTTQGEEVIINVTKLSINQYQGKWSVRAHGGNYEKFGVPVYPEVGDALGYTVEAVGTKGMTINRRAVIQMENGKPKKVSRFL